MKKYVDVIVPLPIAGQYTYSVPDELADKIKAGCRIVVPFGRKKYYTAIVTKVHQTAPEAYETKDIMEVLDESPVLLRRQYDFWQWLADYYLCTLGDVYKAALPSGMKLESETLVVLNPEFEALQPLSEKEQRILDLLGNDSEQCITQLEKSSGIKNLLPVIKALLEKEAILVKEELKRSYKPRVESRVRLSAAMQTEEAVHRQFDALARAPKQLALLMKYIELSGWTGEKKELKEVSRKALLDSAGATSAVLNGLIGKGVFEIYSFEIGRLSAEQVSVSPLNPLSSAQQQAYSEILTHFHQKNVCLLHGVTASGKTEIYIHLIQQAIQAGKQVVYLLPEIALTTQITERLKRVFGNRLGIYHSKFPDAERVEIWRKQLTDDDYDVILGVRSSVFLPFRRLGLVIVDEEHENPYKQQDPAPRYHARNAAIVLASMFGAKTLLGTATPCIETYYNAVHGKYGWVQLTERHQNVLLPHIEVVDIKELARKKRMTAQFSPLLLQKIREALENTARENGTTVHYISQETLLTYNNGMTIRIIPPSNKTGLSDDENDTSYVYYVEYNGFSATFTGDMSAFAEKNLIDDGKAGKTNLLKVAHHGSNTATCEEWVEKLTPEYAVISVGENNPYNLPNDDVLERLKNTQVFRTDYDGDIKFIIHKNGSAETDIYNRR